MTYGEAWKIIEEVLQKEKTRFNLDTKWRTNLDEAEKMVRELVVGKIRKLKGGFF